MYCTVDSDPV